MILVKLSSKKKMRNSLFIVFIILILLIVRVRVYSISTGKRIE